MHRFGQSTFAGSRCLQGHSEEGSGLVPEPPLHLVPGAHLTEACGQCPPSHVCCLSSPLEEEMASCPAALVDPQVGTRGDTEVSLM